MPPYYFAQRRTPQFTPEKTINLIYASSRDWKDELIENQVEACFTDGSSFVREGIRHAGYAKVTPFETMEDKAYPPNPWDFSSIC